MKTKFKIGDYVYQFRPNWGTGQILDIDADTDPSLEPIYFVKFSNKKLQARNQGHYWCVESNLLKLGSLVEAIYGE